MSNKFQSADSFKFKHTLTGASGHFDVLFLHDGLGWPDSKPRLISGYDDNIYHYGKRLLKEGDVAGMSSSTSVTSESTSGIKINAYQANLLSTGDLVRYDIDTNFYVKSIASAKSTSDVVGVVDLISGRVDSAFRKKSRSSRSKLIAPQRCL